MSDSTEVAPNKTQDAVLDPHWVNVISIPLGLGMIGAALGLHLLAWGLPEQGSLWMIQDLRVFLPTIVLGIFVHEGLHALGWKLAGKLPWSQITFGFNLKALMPYAHCKVPMTALAYRIGGALPGLLTGLIPLLIGWLLNEFGLTLLGATFLTAALGDALVLWAIRNVPGQAMVIDHPTLPGCKVILTG